MSTAACNVTTKFVLGGKAIFTLSNGQGTHETFMVYLRKQRPVKDGKEEGNKQKAFEFGDTYFVKVLTGPNNLDDYTYLGLLALPTRRHPDPIVRLTSNSRFREDSRAVKAARFALRAIWQIEAGSYQLPPGYTIHHIGRCGRCGGPLTRPASLDTGFGKDCADILGIPWVEREQEQGQEQVKGAPLVDPDWDDPNTRRTAGDGGPERRRGPRTVHIIDERTSARDFELARHDLVEFLTRKIDGDY